MNRKNLPFLFLAFATTLLFAFLILTSAKEPRTGASGQAVSQAENDRLRNSPDTIRALLHIHASDYFIFQGKPAGFQYDALKALGDSLHKIVLVDLESDPQVCYDALFEQKYDIVALDYGENPWIDFYLTRSVSHSSTQAVLVGKKQGKAQPKEKRLHLPAFFSLRIDEKKLPDSGNWERVCHPEYGTEELLKLLREGEIDYVACAYNEAITLLSFYSDLEISSVLGTPRERFWTLNPRNDSINTEINRWLSSWKKTPSYHILEKRYLMGNSPVIAQSFAHNTGRQISRFDPIIQKESGKYGFDWRFVSSLIYQESKFIDGLTGRGGSYGLMQFMPETASRFGITRNSSPEQQIKAGVAYLNYLRKIFCDIEDAREQLQFIAAAYNSGPGHVLDARRLAEKYQKNPFSWKDVSRFLSLKSKSQYANDPVVKHGYYPGSHTLNYVDQIMKRYKEYMVFPGTEPERGDG